MRTPLNNTIFFLNLILTLVLKYPDLASEFVRELQKYSSFMMSQLTLSLTFVDDILDLNQLRQGVFS